MNTGLLTLNFIAATVLGICIGLNITIVVIYWRDAITRHVLNLSIALIMCLIARTADTLGLERLVPPIWNFLYTMAIFFFVTYGMMQLFAAKLRRRNL